MDLNLIRQDIDKIDAQLIALLEERMGLVNQVTAYKRATGKAVLDTSREQMVLDKVARQVANKDFEEAIVATFSDMMKHSRAYQSRQLGVKEC
ncbi:chorismate mutase [Streptococcus hillyeri]|uniref:Chorismate mutase n=1 Tax=Streptococcus hillyeri TaxID=2282420 RepID=A0A3L9DSK4_9STRE|nr:chorismate mutase [Streptococcus hillyeri]RLY02897.1 chorismate mutase [Streptococcus hillyeri]